MYIFQTEVIKLSEQYIRSLARDTEGVVDGPYAGRFTAYGIKTDIPLHPYYALAYCMHKYGATQRLHYNAVLYNADSIIMRSPHGSQIFSRVNYV